MAIELTDDGTLDTVLRCSDCGAEMRYTFAGEIVDDSCPVEGDDADAYAAFVSWAIEDATADHECEPADDNPSEPDEDAITTSDHRQFYQYDRPVFEVVETVDGDYMLLIGGVQIGGTVDRSGAGNATYPTVEATVRAYMDRVQFWPDAWFISDHGNAHRIDLTEGSK